MSSFSNDRKIETVNTKFVTSILNETITRLSLLQCATVAGNQRDDETEDSTSSAAKTDQIALKKFETDVDNIKSSFYQIISDLGRHQSITDFSGVSAAENESNFLAECNRNKAKLKELRSALLKFEQDIANHHAHTATVDVGFSKFFLKGENKLRQPFTGEHHKVCDAK